MAQTASVAAPADGPFVPCRARSGRPRMRRAADAPSGPAGRRWPCDRRRPDRAVRHGDPPHRGGTGPGGGGARHEPARTPPGRDRRHPSRPRGAHHDRTDHPGPVREDPRSAHRHRLDVGPRAGSAPRGVRPPRHPDRRRHLRGGGRRAGPRPGVHPRDPAVGVRRRGPRPQRGPLRLRRPHGDPAPRRGPPRLPRRRRAGAGGAAGVVPRPPRLRPHRDQGVVERLRPGVDRRRRHPLPGVLPAHPGRRRPAAARGRRPLRAGRPPARPGVRDLPGAGQDRRRPSGHDRHRRRRRQLHPRGRRAGDEGAGHRRPLPVRALVPRGPRHRGRPRRRRHQRVPPRGPRHRGRRRPRPRRARPRRALPRLGVPLPRARGGLPDRAGPADVRCAVLRGPHRLPAAAHVPLRRAARRRRLPRRRRRST